MKWRVSQSILPVAAIVVVLAGCDRLTSVETRISRAEANLASGEYQAALVDLRKALDAEPESIDAQLLLVDVLTASGDLQAARIRLDQAKQAGATPASTESRYLELLIGLGITEGAREALAASTTLSPVQQATFEGHILFQQQRTADALAAYDRALGIEPENLNAAYGRIEALAALGQMAEARAAAAALAERAPSNGRAWLLQGLLAARVGEFPLAAENLTRAIELQQGMTREQRVQAHVARLESQLASAQLEQARASLPALEAAAEQTPVVSLMRARIALADGDTATAVNELRTFTQAARQHLPGRLLLISALQDQGSMEQAFAEAARCVSEFPNADEPRLALATVQLRMGRSSDAEETLRPLVAQSPPNPQATAMLAEIRVRAGQTASGVSLLEQGLVDRPEDSRLKLQLAAAYLSAGDARRALQLLETVREPGLAATQDRLHAIATAALESTADVERELNAALSRHPGDIDLLVTTAAYAANTGRPDLARERLEQARKLRPDDPSLSTMLARLELSVGRVTEAEELTKAALQKAPSDATGMVLMASIASQRGQDTEADAWLNRARIANPGALDISLALARRASVRGDHQQARTILTAAVAQTPRNPGAHVALAELVASQGQHSEALAQLGEAARQNPQSALVQLSTGRIQLAAGNVAAARASFRRALQLEPGWLPAATSLASLEIGAGNSAAALQIARGLRSSLPQSNAGSMLEGEIHMAGRAPARAAAAFVEAYAKSPGPTPAVRALQAKVQARMPRPEEHLVDWLDKTPGDSSARRALGEYYLATGANDAALVQLEQVVESRPWDAIALNNVAWLYQRKGDARARATAEKAYQLAPGSAAVADTYGWILVQGGAAREGLPLLEEAARLAPGDRDVAFHHAYALARENKKDEAAQVLQRILTGNESFASRAEAQELLSELR